MITRYATIFRQYAAAAAADTPWREVEDTIIIAEVTPYADMIDAASHTWLPRCH